MSVCAFTHFSEFLYILIHTYASVLLMTIQVILSLESCTYIVTPAILKVEFTFRVLSRSALSLGLSRWLQFPEFEQFVQ